MENYSLQNDECLLPIIIGVTGHMDLLSEDEDNLSDSIRKILCGIVEGNSKTPLILLSPLAEGADRLAAKVFFDLKREVGNPYWKMYVPLPMPVEEYEKDFLTKASRSEFHDLLRQADDVIELPYVDGNKESLINDREALYEQAGEYIALKSQILIALWDGYENENIGGTYKILNFKLTGKGLRRSYISNEKNILDSVNTGPVHIIATPRAKNKNNGIPCINPNLELEKYNTKVRYPDIYEDEKLAKQIYFKMYRDMNIYNENIYEFDKQLSGGGIEASIKKLISSQSDYYKINRPLKNILYRYAAADFLSMHYQKKYKRSVTITLIFTFIIALSYFIFSNISDSTFFLFSYFALLTSGGICYAVSFSNIRSKFGRIKNHKGAKDRYIDFRALAEGLRIEFFWKLGGIKNSAAEHYLRRQRNGLEWIKNAIRICSMTLDTRENCKQNVWKRYHLELVNLYWIKQQADYYEDKLKHSKEVKEINASTLRSNIYLGINFVLLALMLIAGLAGYNFLSFELFGLSLLTIKNIFKLASGLFLLLVSFEKMRRDKKGVIQTRGQYSSVLYAFYLASRKWEEFAWDGKPETEKEVRNIILELGKEALIENGDWVGTQKGITMDILI